MNIQHLKRKSRRGRKKNTFYKKYKRRIKELVDNFIESESAEAYIGRAVLAMIGLGGILIVGAIAPNIFSAFGRYKKSYEYNEKQVHKSVYYLRKRGLIKFIKDRDGTCVVKITRAGKKKLVEFAIDSIKLKKPDVWDSKWRVVIFDIPEHFKSAREALRKKLKELGLYQLQRSVFIYPYSLEEEVSFTASFFAVEQYIEILTVESMLDDVDIRKYFLL